MLELAVVEALLTMRNERITAVLKWIIEPLPLHLPDYKAQWLRPAASLSWYIRSHSTSHAHVELRVLSMSVERTFGNSAIWLGSAVCGEMETRPYLSATAQI